MYRVLFCFRGWKGRRNIIWFFLFYVIVFNSVYVVVLVFLFYRFSSGSGRVGFRSYLFRYLLCIVLGMEFGV